jgi:hypothetical protein
MPSTKRMNDVKRRKAGPDAVASQEGGHHETITDVIQRVTAEYLEMPGLRLKPEQVQRLCGIERTMCQTALDALVSAKFLDVKPDGHYARLTEGRFPRPHPAKAGLRSERSISESLVSTRIVTTEEEGAMPSTSSPDASSPRPSTPLTIRCCCQCGSHAINISSIGRMSRVYCRECHALVQLEHHPPDAPNIVMRITVMSDPRDPMTTTRPSSAFADHEWNDR